MKNLTLKLGLILISNLVLKLGFMLKFIYIQNFEFILHILEHPKRSIFQFETAWQPAIWKKNYIIVEGFPFTTEKKII